MDLSYLLIGAGVFVAALGIASYVFWPKKAQKAVEEFVHEVADAAVHAEMSAEEKIEHLKLNVKRREMIESIDNSHFRRTIKAHMDVGHGLALSLTAILSSVAFYHVAKTTDSNLTAAAFAIAILLIPIAANFLSWRGAFWNRIFLFLIGMVIIASVLIMNWSILQGAAGEQTQVALGKKEVQAGSFVDSRARIKELKKEIAKKKLKVADSVSEIIANIQAQLDRTWSGRTIMVSTNGCQGIEVKRRRKTTVKRMNRFERSVCDTVRKYRIQLSVAKDIEKKQAEIDKLQTKVLSGRTSASADVQSEELSRLLGIPQDRLQKVIPMLLLSLLDFVHLAFWVGLGIMDQGKLKKQKDNMIRKIHDDVEIERLNSIVKRETQKKAAVNGADVDHLADANAFLDEMVVSAVGEQVKIMEEAFDAYWIWLKTKGREIGMPPGSFRRIIPMAAAERGMVVAQGAIDGYKIK